MKQQPHLSVLGFNLQITEASTPYQRVATPRKKRLEIRRLRLNNADVWKVSDESESPSTTKILRSPYLHLIGKEILIEGKAMPSHILLASDAHQIDVVGFVPIEEYVASVVGSEVSPKWPLETLKAQAVATRSYTQAVMIERSRRLFHVESDVSDQVYKHLFHSNENLKSDIAKVSQAVVETQSMVLTDPSSKEVIKAFYHADCGGRTLSAKQVGLSPKNYGVAEDPWCANNAKSKWSYEFSGEELQKKLKGLLSVEANSLSGLKAFLDSEGRSVDKLELQTDKGNQLISSYDLRRSLGWKNIRSTKFELAKNQQNEYVFKGQGYGHGVGLCQNGSRYLGQKGKKFEEILSHYYPLAQLKKSKTYFSAH